MISIPSEDVAYCAETGSFAWLKPAPGRRVAPCLSMRPDGYQSLYVNGRNWLAHRLAWALHYGQEPPKCIDHINKDKADNRIENLRDGTGGVNEWNSKPRKSEFGVTGVRSSSSGGAYQSFIFKKRKFTQLYYGPDFFEAVCARKSAEARRWAA